MRVVLVCALLLISDIGVYVLSHSTLDDAKKTYQNAVEVHNRYSASIEPLADADQRILKKLTEINDKLDRRIGDGPNTGEAPK